jgi:sugar phosphate isomerase/epimerase
MRGSSITLEDYTLEECVRIFRDAGFTTIEMTRTHLKRCKTDQLVKNFVAYARSMGISMAGLNVAGDAYYQPFGSDRQLEETLNGLQADADLAYSLGTRDVLIWEGVAPKGTTEAQWITDLLPRLIDLFRSAIKAVKSRGMRFLVEPHPFTVGMSDQFLIRLCDALDPEHFGVTFDFCHYGVGRPLDYLEAIPALGHRIRNIHFSDSDQESSELHFPPGTGKLQIQAMLKAFRKIRFDGTMALDLYGYPTPVQALSISAARLREAYEFLGLPY